MLGELDAQQITDLLRTEVIARIGCVSDGRVYVVPVTYVYDGTYIYGHAMDGAKLRAMRANPQVCVEVEQVDNLSNWRSVIAWGTFEECDGADWDAGFAMLAERIMPLLTLPKNQPPPDLSVMRSGSVYRIRVEHMTGRFEEVNTD
jgi:nitroimidazol reductase NimA-like FMN-containing flavoprotein (pyridoxamine 5'-phosphate oxidase superfamily)